MNQNIKCIKRLVHFLGAYILLGILHVVFYGVDFTNNIAQVYSAIFVLLWGFSLGKRITNKAVLRYLYGIVFFLVLLPLSQAAKYDMFQEAPNMMRYCWYAYYLPYIFVPLFFNQVAFRLNMQKNDKIKQWWKILDIPSIILFFLVMTNDFNQLIFKFPNGFEDAIHDYTHAFSFYIIWVLVILQNINSLIIIFKQCAVNASRKMLWLPACFELMFIVGMGFYLTGSAIRVDGNLVWNEGESYIFSMIGLAESCIAMGLIPANQDYNKLFYLVNDMAVIYDNDHNPVYTPKEAEAFFENPNVVVKSNEIHGGSVSYGVDMGPVYELNNSLQAENDRIQARNKLLKSQNDIESEKSRLKAQNDLYDNISYIVKPKLDKIQMLLDESNDENFKQNLSKITVYNSYIKRRSNMELLQSSSELVDINELSLSIHESLEYLKLLNADTMISFRVTGKLPGEMLVLFYDFFETVIEHYVDSLKNVMVSFWKKEEGYILNILVGAEGEMPDLDMLKEDILQYRGLVFFAGEEGDRTISLTLKEGTNHDESI